MGAVDATALVMVGSSGPGNTAPTGTEFPVLEAAIQGLVRAGFGVIHVVQDASHPPIAEDWRSDHAGLPTEVVPVDGVVGALDHVERVVGESDGPVVIVDPRFVADWVLYRELARHPSPSGVVLEVPTNDESAGAGSRIAAVRCSAQHGFDEISRHVMHGPRGTPGPDDSASVAESNSLWQVPALVDLAMRWAGTRISVVHPRNLAVSLAPSIVAPVPEPFKDRTDRVVDRARRDNAVKPMDGVFAAYFLCPWTKHLVAWLAARGAHPNQVTVVSLVLGLAAAAAFAVGSATWTAVAALLVVASFAFDLVDGQLARYLGAYSERGAWLDLQADRVKELAVYIGLAVGANGGASVWVLATAVMCIQTTRISMLASYRAFELQLPEAPVEIESELQRISDETERPVEVVSQPSPRFNPPPMPRGFLMFSLGDRAFVVALVSVVAGAAWVFIVHLVLGGAALLLLGLGRFTRSRRMPSRAGTAHPLRDFSFGPALPRIANGLRTMTVSSRLFSMIVVLPAAAGAIGVLIGVSGLYLLGVIAWITWLAIARPRFDAIAWIPTPAVVAGEFGLMVALAVTGPSWLVAVYVAILILLLHVVDERVRLGARETLLLRLSVLGTDLRPALAVIAVAGFSASAYLAGAAIVWAVAIVTLSVATWGGLKRSDGQQSRSVTGPVDKTQA